MLEEIVYGLILLLSVKPFMPLETISNEPLRLDYEGINFQLPEQIALVVLPPAEGVVADNFALAIDAELQREAFLNQDAIAGRFGNFLFTRKVFPYAPVDGMFMHVPSSEPVDVKNSFALPYLSDAHYKDLLRGMDFLLNSLEFSMDTNDLRFGINLGTAQSVKRLHVHCVDVGGYQYVDARQAYDVLTGLGNANTAKRLISKVGVTEACKGRNVDLATHLEQVVPCTINDSQSAVDVKLMPGSLAANAGLIKTVADILLHHYIKACYESQSETHQFAHLDVDNIFSRFPWSAVMNIKPNERIRVAIKQDVGFRAALAKHEFEDAFKSAVRPGFLETEGILLHRESGVNAHGFDINHVRSANAVFRDAVRRAFLAP